MDYNVWSIIADYIPAHPQRYTRLAQVNKLFHKLFMGDKLWTKLDFYDVKDRISQHYLVKSRAFSTDDRQRLTNAAFVNIGKPAMPKCTACNNSVVLKCTLCGYWRVDYCNHFSPVSKCAHCSLLSSISAGANRYVAFIVATDYPDALSASVKTNLAERVRHSLIKEYGLLKFAIETDFEDLTLVERALVKNPMALRYAPEKVRNNMELACLAIRGNLLAHEHVGEEIGDEPQVYQTCLKAVRQEFGAQTLCT